MLDIVIPDRELFDEEKNEFITIKSQKLKLEHSLISLSKWESKWKKPFLKSEKTPEELIDYIKCMTLTQNVDPLVYFNLTSENLEEIKNYIDDPMTATTIDRKDSKVNREIITAEIIYYWMVALNIPFECEKWHLNKLITLVEVCAIKNEPPKKMSKNEIRARNRELNAARRKKYNTRG